MNQFFEPVAGKDAGGPECLKEIRIWLEFASPRVPQDFSM